VTFHPFRVPDQQEFVEELGVEPTPVDGSETARSLSIEVDPQNRLVFTFDVTGRSVRCRWHQQEVLVLDLFREGAIHLALEHGVNTTSLVTRFESESLAGRLEVQVWPGIAVRDQLLFA